MMRIPRTVRCSLTLVPILVAGCGWFGGDGPLTSDESLLRYVPADTPYILAVAEPLPEEIVQIFEQQMESMSLALETIYQEAAADFAAIGGSAEDFAFLELMTELFSVETLERSGIGFDSTYTIYGYGLLPVFRITLDEGHDMAGVLDRFEELVESSGDAAIETATVAGQAYRYIGDDDARLIVALLEDELVVTVAPSGIDDGLLSSVLGVELPAESLAESGRLKDIADEYGFTPHMVGLLDIEAIAATFVEQQSGVNAMLLDLMGYDLQDVPAVCREEIRGLAGVAPSIVAGYTEISSRELAGNFVIELREDIAEGLATLPRSVQGLGLVTEALFSFGVSLDIPAAREFAATRLDAIEDDPFECELFEDMQASLPDMRIALNTPLPPIVDTLHGLSATVDLGDVSFAALNSMPEDLAVSVLVSTDDAPGLIALASALDPQIATLNLPTDGQIVELELPFPLNDPNFNPFGQAFFVATETLLGVGLGENGAERLGELLAAPAGDASTFMSMSVDMSAYYGLMADFMEMMPALDPEAPPEDMVFAVTDMMRGLQEVYERETLEIRFTEQGVEMPVRLELAQ